MTIVMEANKKSDELQNSESRESDSKMIRFPDVDELLFGYESTQPSKETPIYTKTKKLVSIFVIAILSSVAFELTFLVFYYVFGSGREPLIIEVLFSNGVWIYYGLLGLLIRKLYNVVKDKYDFSYIIKQKVLFTIAIGILSLIFNFNQNVTSYLGKTLMVDDFEYEIGEAGGFSGEFGYYVPIDKFRDGKIQKDNMEFRYNGNRASMTYWGGDLVLNVKKILFWEYAFCEGYDPVLNLHGEEEMGFIPRMLRITPIYFLELIMNNIILPKN